MNAIYPEYEKDVYGWTVATISLIKQRKFNELDIDNLIEEIESMGKQQIAQLKSYLIIFIEHVLKIKYAHTNVLQRNQYKWENSLKNQTLNILEHIEENPSLQKEFSAIAVKAYNHALLSVKSCYDKYGDIDFDRIPEECPYTQESIDNLTDINPKLNKLKELI